MRFLALIIVVAVIYFVWTQRNPMSTPIDAMEEAEAVAPSPTPTAASGEPRRQKGGLRAPLDRTRAVLEQVRERNGTE